MPALSELELLAAFRRYLNEGGCGYFADFQEVAPDFEWFFKSFTYFLTSPEKAQAFEPIGHDGTDSYAAFWNEPGNTNALRPVIWQDSEGQCGVIANSFADFLCLLPYDVWLIKNVLSEFELEAVDAASAPGLVASLSQEMLPGRLERIVATYPDQPRYVEWLTGTLGLKVAEDPIGQIAQAYFSHTNLKAWMEE